MEQEKLKVSLWGGKETEANVYDYVVQFYAGKWVAESVFDKLEEANARYYQLLAEGYPHVQVIQLH